MIETEYLTFLRTTAQVVARMLLGVVETVDGRRVRVDPQAVQSLFRGSVRSFLAWHRQHHRTENKIAEIDPEGAEPIKKPNPIDWPTPGGRRAFQGDRQLVCSVATLCAIHDANKNPAVDVRGWPAMRTVFYRIIRDGATSAPEYGDELPVYDPSVIREARERVAEHLARAAVSSGQQSEAVGGMVKEEEAHSYCQVALSKKDIGLALGLPGKKTAEKLDALCKTVGIHLQKYNRTCYYVALDSLPPALLSRFKTHLRDTGIIDL